MDKTRVTKDGVTVHPEADQVMSYTTANAGLSPGSGSSGNTNSNVEESALQNLNVRLCYRDPNVRRLIVDSDDKVDSASELDSAIGDMTPQTSTTSARSSIYDYVEENGRTYHRYKEGKYMLPNDESEQDRLDLQHQLWMITLYDELHLAPIKEPRNVLDIGTGTGIWAIEYANRNPGTKVVGSDLSPIQPDFVPANCHFEVDDAEDEWNYSTKFDFIHGRAMVTCFKDPGAVFKSAYDSLVPGGYFEMQDLILPMRAIDDTLKGSALDFWAQTMLVAAEKMGRSWKNSANYVRYFEEAGFEDVTERHFQWPSNSWPKGERLKLLGSYWLEDMSKGIEGLSMALLTRVAGMTKEEVLDLSSRVRDDLKNKKMHVYCPIIVVYGRKPL